MIGTPHRTETYLVSSQDRFKRGNPCPICGGYDEARRGQGNRCFGFLSNDTTYAHCTREELAGRLIADGAGTYAHRMEGECKCGAVHGQSSVASSPVVAVYDYGEYRINRTFDKQFFVQHKVAGDWEKGLGEREKHLYKLPEIRQAIQQGQVIFIVEGEKAVEYLWGQHLPATTAPFGGNTWLDSYSQEIAGALVVVVADNSEKGRNYTQKVCASLSTTAKSVRSISRLPGFEKELDQGLDDWLQNHSLDELAKLVSAASPVSNKTVFEKFGRGYRAVYPGGQRIEIRNIREDRKTILAEVTALDSSGQKGWDMALNLGSSRTRNSFANDLGKEFDWRAALQQTAESTIKAFRLGEPVRWLSGQPKHNRPTFMIEPIVYESDISILFSDGGVGKSMFMLWLAACASNAEKMPAPLKVKEPVTVGFFDFERDQEVHEQRLHRIKLDLASDPRILYQKVRVPLPMCANRISEIVTEHKIGLVILDSLSWAAPGDLNEAKPAIDMVNLIREIPCPVLASAHVSAQSAYSDGKTSPFGSRFFHNGPAILWEMKRNGSNLAFHNTKNNFGDPVDPFGLCLESLPDNGPMRYFGIPITSDDQLTKGLPLRDQLDKAFEELGSATVAELSDYIGAADSVIKTTLHRHKDRRFATVEDTAPGRGNKTVWKKLAN